MDDDPVMVDLLKANRRIFELEAQVAALTKERAEGLRLTYQRTPDCQTMGEAVQALLDVIAALTKERDEAWTQITEFSRHRACGCASTYRCFNCGDIFTGDAAATHFGEDKGAEALCAEWARDDDRERRLKYEANENDVSRLQNAAAAHDEREKQMLDALEMAWGVIANAGGGDWETQSVEWQEVAARWRDEHWHKILGVGKALSPAQEPKRCVYCSLKYERQVPTSECGHTQEPKQEEKLRCECLWYEPGTCIAERCRCKEHHT